MGCISLLGGVHFCFPWGANGVQPKWWVGCILLPMGCKHSGRGATLKLKVCLLQNKHQRGSLSARIVVEYINNAYGGAYHEY